MSLASNLTTRDDDPGRTGNDSKSMAYPCHLTRLFANPFSRTERAANHEQRSNKFMPKGREVLAALNECRGQRQEETGRDEGNQVAEERRNLFNDSCHHDSLTVLELVRF